MSYLAYDRDDHTICGMADTVEGAIDDARRHVIEEWDQIRDRIEVEPCTDRLAKEVANLGGQIQWQWAGTPAARFMDIAH